jgi:Gram-negative bacterial TonB protein C-terminal
MLKLIPLSIGRFDHSDTIQSITAATLSGRLAKCIHFETVNGRTHQSNEIRVDAEQGTVLRWNVGDELVEDSEFYMFEGVWRPAHIRQYINGKLRMEIEQKLALIDGAIDWATLTPPNAATYVPCQKYDRPLIQSAPQPPSAGAGPWYDVKVHGNIGVDGHVHDASVLAVGRVELEQQAIQIVSQWVFSPAMCDGKPVASLATLTIHFSPQ